MTIFYKSSFIFTILSNFYFFSTIITFPNFLYISHTYRLSFLSNCITLCLNLTINNTQTIVFTFYIVLPFFKFSLIIHLFISSPLITLVLFYISYLLSLYLCLVHSSLFWRLMLFPRKTVLNFHWIKYAILYVQLLLLL